MIIILIVVILLGIALMFYSKLAMVEERVKRQDRLLERLLKHMEIETPVSEEVLALLRKGKEVQAVKEARERFGLSLLEAKQYVDQLKDKASKY